MDREQFKTIIRLVPKHFIMQMHFLVGSTPVSFARLRHYVIEEMIEEGIKQNMRDEEIAIRAGVCKRTVERYKRKKLYRYRDGISKEN
jgi:hypothetical protein